MSRDTLGDVLEIVSFIKDNMATHDELNEFRDETRAGFRNLTHDIADIIKRLDALDNAVTDIRGYAKEIDALRARLNAIEKHLGLSHRIAA